MRVRMIVVALSGLLAAGAATLYASRSDPFTLTPSVPTLEDRVVTLERTVEALNRRIAAMELQQAKPVFGPDRLPRMIVPPSASPDGWKPFEFNGQWYYIVPLDAVPAR